MQCNGVFCKHHLTRIIKESILVHDIDSQFSCCTEHLIYEHATEQINVASTASAACRQQAKLRQN